MTAEQSTKSKVTIVMLNSLLLVVLVISAWCYKDQSEYAAKGGEPFGIIFLYVVSFPSLIILGTILVSFKNRLQIPLLNGLIPFTGILAFIFPLLFDIIRRPRVVGFIGVAMGAALSLITVAITAANLVSKRNKL
jgi:hypothetical protein